MLHKIILHKIYPFQHSNLFMGHTQRMQTQIRRSAAPDQSLHLYHKNYSTEPWIKMKNATKQPYKHWKQIHPKELIGKSMRLEMVKYTVHVVF